MKFTFVFEIPDGVIGPRIELATRLHVAGKYMDTLGGFPIEKGKDFQIYPDKKYCYYNIE